MVASSRRRPIQTLPSRSAIGACKSAMSGRVAGTRTTGSGVSAEGVWEEGGVGGVLEHVGADQPAHRREGRAFLGCRQARMDSGAGAVEQFDRAERYRAV